VTPACPCWLSLLSGSWLGTRMRRGFAFGSVLGQLRIRSNGACWRSLRLRRMRSPASRESFCPSSRRTMRRSRCCDRGGSARYPLLLTSLENDSQLPETRGGGRSSRLRPTADRETKPILSIALRSSRSRSATARPVSITSPPDRHPLSGVRARRRGSRGLRAEGRGRMTTPTAGRQMKHWLVVLARPHRQRHRHPSSIADGTKEVSDV
jgi:hypothetical protein